MISKDTGTLVDVVSRDGRWHFTVLLDSGEYITTYNGKMNPLSLDNIGKKLQDTITFDSDKLYKLTVNVEHEDGLLLYIELHGRRI